MKSFFVISILLILSCSSWASSREKSPYLSVCSLVFTPQSGGFLNTGEYAYKETKKQRYSVNFGFTTPRQLKELQSVNYDLARTPVFDGAEFVLSSSQKIHVQRFKSVQIAELELNRKEYKQEANPAVNTKEMRESRLRGKDFINRIQINLKRLFERYNEDRGWGANFISRLIKDVDLYAPFSKFHFIFSKDKFQDKLPRVDGIIKYITMTGKDFERYDLPFEREMDIRVQSKYKVKIEVGNFEIEKDNYFMVRDVLLQTMRQQVLHWQNKVPPSEKIFYAYGDRKSVRMYRSFGMSIDKRFPPKQFPDNKGRMVDWWVLSGSVSSVRESLFFDLGFKKPKPGMSLEHGGFKYLPGLGMNLKNHTYHLGKDFQSRGVKSDQITRIELMRSKSLSELRGEEVVIPLTLLFDTNVPSLYKKTLSFFIPQKAFPLNANKVSSFRDSATESVTELSLSNGILKLTRRTETGFQELKLKVNRDLSEMKFISFWERSFEESGDVYLTSN